MQNRSQTSISELPVGAAGHRGQMHLAVGFWGARESGSKTMPARWLTRGSRPDNLFDTVARIRIYCYRMQARNTVQQADG